MPEYWVVWTDDGARVMHVERGEVGFIEYSDIRIFVDDTSLVASWLTGAYA